jgi:hypothetical protein
MRPEPIGSPTRGLASRGLLAAAVYALWFVSAALGLAVIFAVRRLAEAVLVVALAGGGAEAGKWVGPLLIVVTVVAGLVLLVLILVWEERYRKASLGGFRPLLRRFGAVTAGEVGTIVGAVLLSLVLLRIGV